MHTPRRSGTWVWRQLGDEVVILAESGTEIVTLNETGARIWLLSDGEHDVHAIANEIAREFAVTREQALSDVEAYCAELERAGLLEASAPRCP